MRKFLIAILLLLTAPSLWAGQAYTALMRAIPTPDSDQIEQWVLDLVDARIKNCPLARTTTYYFDPVGGLDANSGSQGSPFQTLTKLQSVHDAAGANADIAFLLKAGTTFDVTGNGVLISKNNCTIATYGAGAPPVLNHFTNKYNAAGWTLVSGTLYKRTETTDIACLWWQNGDLNSALMQVATSAACSATTNTFFHDNAGTDPNSASTANTLYVNVGADANTKNLWSVTVNSNYGIRVSGDGNRIHGIRAQGFGCQRTTNFALNQTEGIQSIAEGTNENVFSSCECYFGQVHAMTHYVGTGGHSGGIITLVNCKSGLTCYNSGSGETVYNCFSDAGGYEFVTANCEVSYGTRRNDAWYNSSTMPVRGHGAFSHTSSGTANLVIHYRMRMLTSPNGWAADTGPLFANTPTATTKDQVRCLDLYGRKDAVNGDWDGFKIATPNVARVGCRYGGKPRDNAAGAPTTATPGGWVIACTLDIDTSNIVANSGTWGFWNAASAATQLDLWQNHIRFYTIAANTGVALDWKGRPGSGGASAATTGNLRNNVIQNDGLGTAYLGWGQNTSGATRIQSNAYFGITASGDAGYNTDATAVVMARGEGLDQRPRPGTPLYRAGLGGVGPMVDQDGVRYSNPPSIGPFSDLPASSKTTATSTGGAYTGQ